MCTKKQNYRVVHNSFITIPGELDHPQATAPGYAMYFCWMIRHLENNPWNDRIMEEDHKWLLEPNVKNLVRKGINRKTSTPIYSDRVLIFLFMRIKENPFYCYRRAIVLHTFEEGEFQSNKIR